MLLKDSVAWVESRGNQTAVRFEPVLFVKTPVWILGTLGTIEKAHPSFSAETCRMIACTSWGKYQILGANIWSMDFDGTYFDYVQDASQQIQDRVFAQFVGERKFFANQDINQWSIAQFFSFATFYNGPNNVVEYVKNMRKAGMA